MERNDDDDACVLDYSQMLMIVGRVCKRGELNMVVGFLLPPRQLTLVQHYQALPILVKIQQSFQKRTNLVL